MSSAGWERRGKHVREPGVYGASGLRNRDFSVGFLRGKLVHKDYNWWMVEIDLSLDW